MTSQINADNIDGAFPVAGQDNPSQGFRDNFTNIKTAISVAKSEITDLQSSRAKLNDDNDFNGRIIENAVYNKFFGGYTNNGSGILLTLNVENAPFQKYTVTSSASIQITNLTGSDKYKIVRLHVVGNSSVVGTATITFSLTTGSFKTDSNFSAGSGTNKTLPIAANQEKVVEISTYDGGLTVYLRYLGQFS